MNGCFRATRRTVEVRSGPFAVGPGPAMNGQMLWSSESPLYGQQRTSADDLMPVCFTSRAAFRAWPPTGDSPSHSWLATSLAVDGRQHYAVFDGGPPDRYITNAERYAEMAAEDRRLRLMGYDVYRFGGTIFWTSTCTSAKSVSARTNASRISLTDCWRSTVFVSQRAHPSTASTLDARRLPCAIAHQTTICSASNNYPHIP